MNKCKVCSKKFGGRKKKYCTQTCASEVSFDDNKQDEKKYSF